MEIVAMSQLKIGLTLLLALSCEGVFADINTKDLGQGWWAMVKQSDPFDTSKIEIIQISKGKFTFKCREINMLGRSSKYNYKSYSFNASLKYAVDEKSPVDKSGGFSSYLSGSDLMTDSRYYHFSLNESDLMAFKEGNSVKVAGQWSKGMGWFAESLNLAGFTNAYTKMCE